MTTQRGHHLPGPAPWSSTTPVSCPGRARGGAGEHLLRLVLPSQPAGTLALDESPWSVGGEAPRSRRAAEAAAWAAVEPACEPGTANAAPSLPVRSGSGRRPSRPRTAARRTRCANGAARSTEPFQGPARHRQRGYRAADTGGLSVRTAGRDRTRGHRTRGHRTRGHRTSARPIGRTCARRTADADTATTGVAGVRTSWRPATTRWAAKPRSGRSVWGRSATRYSAAVTTPAPRP
jgi:hypothetical protein